MRFSLRLSLLAVLIVGLVLGVYTLGNRFVRTKQQLVDLRKKYGEIETDSEAGKFELFALGDFEDELLPQRLNGAYLLRNSDFRNWSIEVSFVNNGIVQGQELPMEEPQVAITIFPEDLANRVIWIESTLYQNSNRPKLLSFRFEGDERFSVSHLHSTGPLTDNAFLVFVFDSVANPCDLRAFEITDLSAKGLIDLSKKRKLRLLYLRFKRK